MGPIGVPEAIIILVILLVIFGPKRLPGVGKSLGTGMREFKESITGDSKKDDEPEERRALTPAPTTTTAATATADRPAEPVHATPAAEDDAPPAAPRA